jgi:hypothetical protein
VPNATSQMPAVVSSTACLAIYSRANLFKRGSKNMFYINYLLIKTKLNNNGVNMPKPIQFKTLLLLMLLFSSSTNVFSAGRLSYLENKWKDSRYIVDHENETVTDTITALMWKRCPEGLRGDSCKKGDLALYTYQGAIERANEPFATYSDWRLPNIKELASLVALDRNDPAINTNIFPTISGSNFWSSSPSRYSNNGGYSWGLDFAVGRTSNRHHRNNRIYVRLVRDVE